MNHYTEKCKTCAGFDRDKNKVNYSVYCSKRASGKTKNGQLKIKANQQACYLYRRASVSDKWVIEEAGDTPAAAE